jgi:hypothetical protein
MGPNIVIVALLHYFGFLFWQFISPEKNFVGFFIVGRLERIERL